MRRAVIHDSDEDHEQPKTVRKTRATLAAASTEASPMRRSTRIRQGSVNRDGSSPESLTGSHAAPTVTRVTRRRVAAAAAEGTQLLDVPRSLRSRKTSLSSNVSEVIDLDSAPGTPRKSKRLPTIQSSPDTPKPKPTRRSTRATSEANSPAPVVATTRRTRANSIEPEPTAIGTPTRRRRTQVSAPPNEPSVTEDVNEDNGEDTAKRSLDDVTEVPEDKEASSGKKSSRNRSSSSSAKKSPKKEKPEIDESVIDREISPVKNEDLVNTAEEAELLDTPKETTKQSDSSALDIADGGKPIQKTSGPMIHVNKRGSFDKSKELGVQIESLLNKSSEELANSPGDKENQKANISPDKVRKNLDVTVSNVNIVRGKPVGFEFVNQSFETKINSWLDDRGLAKSRYETVTPKRDDVKEGGKDSNLETGSSKKPDNEAKEERRTTESGKKKKKLRLNVEKTVVDSVVVREFTLSESDSSDDSQSEFSLAIEDDAVDKEKKGSAANTSSSKQSKIESDEESNEEILERHTPKKHNSSKTKEKDGQGNDSMRLNLSLKRLEDETEDKRRASMEKKPNDEIEEPESKSNGPEDSQEAMNIAEEEKTDHSDNSTPEALAQDLISFEEAEPLVNGKNHSFKADESKRKSLIDSEIDSDVVVSTLFQNISAEEWKKKRDRSSAKRHSNRKSGRLPSNDDDDSDDDDLITVGDKTMPEDELETDSDSDDTLILNKPADKRKKSMDQTIFEEAETQDDEEEEKTKKKRKSLNKSTKSNTSLMETEAEDAKNSSRKSIGKTQEDKKDPKIDDEREPETQDEGVAEEETKKKRKSLNKSTKSNTSLIENEIEAETAKDSRRKSIGKTQEDKKDPKIDDEREPETQDEGVAEEETKKKRKSLNKSTKSNTSLIENEIEAETAKDSRRKSIGKTQEEKEDPKIVDEREAETQDEEVAEEKPKKKRNSLNKSTKSNTSLIENEMEVDEAEDTNKKSMSKASEPMDTEDSIVSMEEEKVEEEKQPGSAKKTPKKSNKMPHVCEFSDESETDNEKDEEEKSFADAKLKSAKKPAVQMLKTPLNKNYSTIADVDSDSVRGDISESESSDEEETTLPGFLFSVPSSGDEDEDYDPNATKDESNDTIDSDVAKELNLAGDDDVKYSDDDVAADECRESESEHSDEDDNGSDILDFVVADDEVESSEGEEEEEEEEEESTKKTRFRRILDKSSSEDEEAETEAIQEVESTPAEIEEESVVESPEEEEKPAFVPSELRRRTLDYSPESARKSLSDKKSKKLKSGEELKPINGPAKTLLDHTVDLCTPEQAEPETAKKSGGKRDRSSENLRKNLVEDLGALTPVQSGAAKEEKTKTPKSSGKKEKQRTAEKTPEAADKKNRDSIQLIQDLDGLTKPSVSDLNKTMDTPNSETPLTKFLKKERLNESLPFMKLKRKSSMSFDKTALNQMSEDEQEDEEPAENYERKDISEESGDQEEANDDAEETGDEINGNGNREDEEDDDTDQQPDENEDNVDENGDEDEKEDEETEESDDEEELSVKIDVVEEKRNSKGRLSLTEELGGNTRLSNGRPSTSTVINGAAESDEEVFSSKKKQASNSALLQLPNQKKRPRSTTSCETPQSMKKTKKFKAVPQTEEADESDSDEAPVSLGFGKAKTEAIQAMKDVAESLKAGKVAKKKKRREQLERIKKEKETKAAKSNLKRLPEDLLENLPDVPERPKKRRKLSRKAEPILPSRAMFSPGKTPPRLKIEETDSPVSSVGGTTHFSVVNLEKVKKQPKKAAAAASFRDLMLARNPRQPVSAFLMYKAKQKASGKQLPRKRAD